MFFVYIIFSEKAGKKYIGQTVDLELRLDQHNSNFYVSYTNNKGPWILVHSESYLSRGEAIIREKYLKSGAGRDWIKRTYGI
jgi:putative endonuclease